MAHENYLHSEVLTHEPADEMMLALHGLLGSHEYLRPVASELEGDFEVTALDLLGFGESPQPEGLYTPDVHADAVSAAVGSLALATEVPLTVVSHSLGAVVGLRFAAKNPLRVKNLVLIDMPIHRTEKEGYRLLRHATKLNWFMATKPGGRLLHTMLFERSKLAKRYAHRKFGPAIANDVDKHTFESFSQSLVGLIERPGGTLSDLQAVVDAGISATIIYGDKDRWVNQASRDHLATLPGVRVHELSGDHHLPAASPKQVANIIKQLRLGDNTS